MTFQRLLLLAAAAAALLLAGGCIVRSTSPTVEVAAPEPVVATPPTVYAAPEAPPIASASGTISYPGEVARYPFQIDYPRTVTIYVEGFGLDPTLRVYDGYGGQIGYDDDGGSGLDSRLVLTLSPGGYVLEVAGYMSSTGSFAVTVN